MARTPPSDPGGARPPDVDVEVRRSFRRRRTVSAYRDGDRVVVLIPARFSKAEERRWVAEMVGRLDARTLRRERGPRRSDAALLARARQLSATVLDGRAQPGTVRWVGNMRTRWGSCTPPDASIRISERLRDMPRWVLDYVLVHELAHLLVPGHGPDFWDLVGRYPRSERARGYLEGLAAAAQLPIEDDDGGADVVEPGEDSDDDDGQPGVGDVVGGGGSDPAGGGGQPGVGDGAGGVDRRGRGGQRGATGRNRR